MRAWMVLRNIVDDIFSAVTRKKRQRHRFNSAAGG